MLVATLPGLRFAYRAPAAHVALETAAALVALLGAFLVLGRLRRSARLGDYLLLVAFSVLALTNLVFATVPSLDGSGGGLYSTWCAIGGHAVAAALFAIASLPLSRRVSVPSWTAPLAAVGLVGLVAATIALLEPFLPGVVTTLTPEGASRPRLDGHAAVLALQLLIAALYAVAAVGFVIRAERRRDRFLTWLAVATTLAAVSRVHYFLYPSLYSQWVYTGDLFRLGFYLALLVGALEEIAAYWRAAAAAAVLEERRRIARDLHDGLAQEVAYISRASALLRDPDPDGDLPERLKAAAERAYRESRNVIAALSSPVGEPLEALLERVAQDAAARFGATVDLDLAPGAALDPARTEALVRIAGEAVANAARHSGAGRVQVELGWRGDRPRLRVTDRGAGFEPAGPTGGFGLTSMRERAAAVGAEFRIQSRPGGGTRVEVAF